MKYRSKIAEFRARADEELVMLANDNQPPAKKERVRRLIKLVMEAERFPREDYSVDRPLTEAEAGVIRTLVDYGADNCGVLSILIVLAVEITFAVPDLAQLRAPQFDAVVRYLVHLLERVGS